VESGSKEKQYDMIAKKGLLEGQSVGGGGRKERMMVNVVEVHYMCV
jgi:hypothetical protein